MCHIWVKMSEKWKPEKVKLKSLRNAHWNREVKNEGTTQQKPKQKPKKLKKKALEMLED